MRALAEPVPEFIAYARRPWFDFGTIAAHAGVLGLCLCKFFGSNSGEIVFEFDRDGVQSVVIEALAADGHSVIDLIAWPINAPWQFASAVREADMLGAWNMVRRGGQSLRVHRTPEDWLAARCIGCVPINLEWAGHWLHRAGGPFIATDIDHGREVRELLGRHAHQHQIRVPRESMRAA